ncbi:MAG: YcxB family protein [Cyanobacteria bacterium J06648_1]
MEQTVHIKYIWNSEDLVRAYKYHKKSSRYFWLSRCFIIVFGIANLGFGILGLASQLSNSFAIFQLIIGLFLLMSEPISNRFYSYRCKRLNYDGREVEWAVSEEKILYRLMNLSESTFTWELIIGALDTPHGFLLYPQKNLFYFIPKEGFKNLDDVAQFAYIAQNSVQNFQQVK